MRKEPPLLNDFSEKLTTVNSEYQPELVGAHIQTIPYIIEPTKNSAHWDLKALIWLETLCIWTHPSYYVIKMTLNLS